jgi:hypothetical protein
MRKAHDAIASQRGRRHTSLHDRAQRPNGLAGRRPPVTETPAVELKEPPAANHSGDRLTTTTSERTK